MTRLNPLLSIGGHLTDTLRAHRPGVAREQVRQRAEDLLQRVGITADRFNSYPHEFSGGMRQRVAIALAMALNPPLVIADEPTTSLDVAVAAQVMAELCSLCAELGSALLLISHDLALAGKWCEQMAVLEQGRLLEQGSVNQVLQNPQQPLTKRLVAAARRREGGDTPNRQKRQWYWNYIRCAVGTGFPLCRGVPVGLNPLMGFHCGSMPLKPLV